MLECLDKSTINSENNVPYFFVLLLYAIDLIEVLFLIIRCYNV